jgi:hypothetical protein
MLLLGGKKGRRLWLERGAVLQEEERSSRAKVRVKKF